MANNIIADNPAFPSYQSSRQPSLVNRQSSIKYQRWSSLEPPCGRWRELPPCGQWFGDFRKVFDRNSISCQLTDLTSTGLSQTLLYRHVWHVTHSVSIIRQTGHLNHCVHHTLTVLTDIYPRHLLLRLLWSPLIRGKTGMETRCLSI